MATGAPSGVVDTLDQFEVVAGLPEQLADAVAALEAGVAGLPPAGTISTVLVLGMGGSGIAGDVLAAVAAPQSPVPILVSKDYELPGFAGPGTLVIAV